MFFFVILSTELIFVMLVAISAASRANIMLCSGNLYSPRIVAYNNIK